MQNICLARGDIEAYLSRNNILLPGEPFIDFVHNRLLIGGKDGRIYKISWFGKLKEIKKYRKLVEPLSDGSVKTTTGSVTEK